MEMKCVHRILSLLLALVLIFELIPTGAMAADGGAESLPEEESIAREVEPGESSLNVVGEIEEYRDEREKHFRMEDGSFLAVDYGVPVHYALDEETWADIDNTLILQNTASPATSSRNWAASREPQRYTAVNGDDAKTFSGDLSTGFLFSTQRGGAAVAMSLLDGLTAPKNEEAPLPEETVPETEPET